MEKWRGVLVARARLFGWHGKLELSLSPGSSGEAPGTTTASTVPTISNIARLLSLPNELIFLIVGYLDNLKDINSLSKANRQLACVITPILHKIGLRSKNGSSAIHWAAARGHEPLVRLILAKGGNVNKTDWMGSTPLHQAIHNCHIATVTLLLESGANVSATDLVGCTPLHMALRGYRAVLEGGAKMGSLNAQEHRPPTQLHEAAIRILLRHGADPNAKTGDGDTPLHYATKYCHSSNHSLIELLLDSGANPLLRNSRQRRASDQLWDRENSYRMIKRREWVKEKGYIRASILCITGGYRRKVGDRTRFSMGRGICALVRALLWAGWVRLMLLLSGLGWARIKNTQG